MNIGKTYNIYCVDWCCIIDVFDADVFLWSFFSWFTFLLSLCYSHIRNTLMFLFNLIFKDPILTDYCPVFYVDISFWNRKFCYWICISVYLRHSIKHELPLCYLLVSVRRFRGGTFSLFRASDWTEIFVSWHHGKFWPLFLSESVYKCILFQRSSVAHRRAQSL